MEHIGTNKVKLCGLLRRHQSFEEACCLCLQGGPRSLLPLSSGWTKKLVASVFRVDQEEFLDCHKDVGTPCILV